MKKTKIIVCCHKSDVYIDAEPYYPIHVGKALSDSDLNIIGDNTGDNISMKNKSYCELTGMYWAWKNMKNIDIVGLCHYRRYFDFHNQCHRFLPYENFPKDAINKLDFSIPSTILNKVSNGNVVVSSPIYYPYSLATDYCVAHISDDFRTLEKIVNNGEDEKYRKSFATYMHKNNALSHYNMFLMNWETFNDYCTWLFNLLEKVELAVNITNYSMVQKRVFGFMAERLLNIYIMANDIKTITKPVIRICDPAGNISPYVMLRNRFRFSLANMLTTSNSLMSR